MAFLLAHSPLVHSLGPAVCTPASPGASTPALINQFIVGLAPLMYGRVDPIIAPGNASAHVHLGMGGSNWGPSMDADTALSSSCTSAQAKADNSDYWTPRLSFKSPQNGSYIPVPNTQEKVYYSSSMKTSDAIVAFEPGFQMLIGDPYRRNMTDATPLEGGGIYLGRDSGQGIPQPVQFTCPTADGSNPYAKQNPYANSGLGFPMANCDAYATGLRYDIYYPDCWDGKSLTDYKSGRAYSSTAGTEDGYQNCEEGWQHLPAMHMEVYWDIDSFARSGVWNPASDPWPFQLAQGDPTGFGIHGDFFAGWDKAILEKLIANGTDGCQTCDGDNEVDACSDASILVNTLDEMNACNVPSPVDEPIWGWLENQPGCNKPQLGPEEAVQATYEEAGLSTPSTTQHTDVPGWTYQGCYLDFVNFDRLLTGASASLPSPVTPEWCAGFCSGTGTADATQTAQTTKYTWMLLEYSYQCFCGDKPSLVESPSNTAVNGLVQGLCNSVCTADQTQICGGSNGGYSPASLYSLGSAGNSSSSTKEKRTAHLHRHAHAHGSSF